MTDRQALEREAQLATLVVRFSERLQAGENLSLEKACAEHPEFATEIAELWGVIRLAELAGSSQSGEDDRPALAPQAAARGALQATAAALGSSDSGAGLSLPFLLGDFELLEEIGRGGMGVVYRARQVSLDRIVAVKMVIKGEFALPADLARFRAEAEAAARLDHPGIVPVYAVGEQDGRAFFSMKYVPGRTLGDLLRDGPLPPRRAAGLLAQVARSIDYAHAQGVLHRDLKPSNILLDENDRPYVTDFGLAKRHDQGLNLTRTGAVLGTPAYMAPEQAAGDRGQAGPTSDVYSLGVILYQMLTGRPPFQAAAAVDVVLMVLEQEPPPPRLLVPQVDRDLELIALRCLQKPPALRYATAGLLAADLEAYLAGEPVSARSGRFAQVLASVFRETHHAVVLENWGLLWMWHSLALLVVCLITNGLYWAHVESRWVYGAVWTAGLGTWAAVFWALRRRMGPVLFVERQIAHLWAASMASIALLFPLEALMGMPLLRLSPLLGIVSGSVFLAKAGILSGEFYIPSAALFLTAFAMAQWPQWAHAIFGVVSAACFFFPGLKYYRQRRRTVQRLGAAQQPKHGD